MYVDKHTGAISYKLGVYDSYKGLAYGYYQNSLSVTGWSVLEINTNGNRLASDGSPEGTRLMYAAGYLEGLLTAR